MKTADPSRVLPLLMMLVAAGTSILARADETKSEGDRIVAPSTAVLQQSFAEPRLEAVRNLMGAVRAIYIAPALKQGPVIVSGTTGKGILLRRHGRDWSDPVFLNAKSPTVGFQAGLAGLQCISHSSQCLVVLTGVELRPEGGQSRSPFVFNVPKDFRGQVEDRIQAALPNVDDTTQPRP
jgi:hypothetical protein